MEVRIPRDKVTANPFTGPEPKIKSIIEGENYDQLDNQEISLISIATLVTKIKSYFLSLRNLIFSS